MGLGEVPRTKYVFGVCVPSRLTTVLQPRGLHDPTEGFETRQEHKLTLNTALKIFKTPIRLWGQKKILKKEEYLESNIST